MGDMLFASGVYTQFQQDRDFPASTIVSSSYVEQVEAQGLSSTHLKKLKGKSDATVRDLLESENAAYGLDLESYVDRAIDAKNKQNTAEAAKKRGWMGTLSSLPTALLPTVTRPYDRGTVVGLIREYQRVIGGSGTTSFVRQLGSGKYHFY